MFKPAIISALVKQTKLRKEEIESLIEIPPNPELGDFAFPCFILSKKEKKSPVEVASNLVKKLGKIENIQTIKATGPYINFFVDKNRLAEEIIKINSNYGRSNIGKKRKLVIDFSAPNIGKPMHIGHIRSTILGDSITRIYDYLNYDTIGINYLGDIGLHIGKLIVAYELWLDKEALKLDPVQELLRLYVKFCAKEKTKITEGAEEEFQDNEWTNKAKDKLKQIEFGDEKTISVWKEIKKHSEIGFNKVYDLLKVNFTETIGQSHFSDKGKQLVMNALRDNIAKREKDGAVYVELNGQKKYILRNNETAAYITQDLGAALERYKKYNFDKMIYITDFRQEQHFDSLFTILKLLGYDWADKLIHLKFGTVKFGNEIIASRTGDIILLEDVLKKTIEKASKEIKKRKTKGDPEKVGVGAVKYTIIKNEPIKDVNFSWEQALSFEGNTGPYLQYSYARASSIIRKAKSKSKPKIKDLTNSEILLLNKISTFPEVVKQAAEKLNPALIANYSFELAQVFNEFYHNCPVIGSKEESFRLSLIESFRTTLKNSLHLIGIEVMEEM